MTSPEDRYKDAANRFCEEVLKTTPQAALQRLTTELSLIEKGIENRERHVLVVGGAGYVGNVLIRRLLDRGYRVRCFDALLYPTGGTIAPLLDHPWFSFVHGDIRNAASVEQALSGITDVVLLAALVGDPISKKYPDETREINLTAALRLFSGLNGRELQRFVFTSTCSNYGIAHSNEPIAETAPLNPKSIYAETKVAMEEFVMEHSNSTDFVSTILRIATAFGLSPRMRFDLTISEFSRDVALGKHLRVFDEQTWRPYCHVLDISEAIMLVLEARRELVESQIFNVGANVNNFTKRMIVEEIKKLVPDANVSYEKGGIDMRDYRVSFNKIASDLGFKPFYIVPQSIARVVECVQAGLFADVELRREFYGNYTIKDSIS